MPADFAYNVIVLESSDATRIRNAMKSGADLFDNGRWSWRWLGEDITGGKQKQLRSVVFSKVYTGLIYCVHIIEAAVAGHRQLIVHSGFDGFQDRKAVEEFCKDMEITTPIQDEIPVIQLQDGT